MQITDKTIHTLPVPAKGNRLYYDDGPADVAVRGMAVRVTASGARSFVLNYRIKGRERRITIGDCADWSLKAARTQASQWKRGIDVGIDPLAEREAARPDDDASFKARAETFLEHGRRKRGLPLRPATKREYRRALMDYAKALHGKPLAEIKRGEIATVIQRVAKERGEVSAMRCRAALSRLYSWAIANGHAETNPVTGTEGYDTPKRKRTLDDDEARLIWRATDKLEAFSMIVRLCMWTGTRRGEPGGMRKSELAAALWTVPGERTKNHRPLVLPLPRQAVAALAAWQEHRGEAASDVLFGRGPNGFTGWSAAKRRLDARIAKLNAERRVGRKLADGEKHAPGDAVDNWDLHDIRRMVETRLAKLRVPKEIVNRTLNHAQGPITEAYDMHTYLDEKAEALQAWADTLERIVGEAPPNVMPLRSAS